MVALNEDLTDFLKEIINIGIGDAANALNQMTESHVQMQIPQLLLFDQSNINQYFNYYHNQRLSSVEMPFKSEISGMAKLIFSSDSAIKLAKILLADTSFDDSLDMLRISAISELGNIIINAVISAISGMFGIYMEYSMPVYLENTINNIIDTSTYSNEFVILLCQTNFFVQSIGAKGDLVLLFEITDFADFSNKIQEYYNKQLAS